MYVFLKGGNCIVRKIGYIIGALLAIAGGLFIIQNAEATGPQVPDQSCFTFTRVPGPGYIVTGYNDDLDICPGDISIPSAFGGLPVIGIISGVFSINTTIQGITVPGSVKTIASDTFTGRNIKRLEFSEGLLDIRSGATTDLGVRDLVLPASLEVLGDYAFRWMYDIQKVTIKSPKPDIVRDDLVQFAYAGVDWELVIESPACKENLDPEECNKAVEDLIAATLKYVPIDYPAAQPRAHTYIESGQDENGVNQSMPAGGYVINPSQVHIRYVDNKGRVVHPDRLEVGKGLTDYRLASNPQHDTSLYYLQGQNITLQPPVVAGYSTPAAQEVALSKFEQTVTFVYQSQDGTVAGGSKSNVTAPNTGAARVTGVLPIALLASVPVVAGGILGGRRLYLRATKHS